MVQRIELADDESIEQTEIVTEFTQGRAYGHFPILLAVEEDFCQACPKKMETGQNNL